MKTFGHDVRRIIWDVVAENINFLIFQESSLDQLSKVAKTLQLKTREVGVNSVRPTG